ncbi:MAG: aldehyde dehydrogenase family protein [Ruminococcus sp.]|nr:aldehyde dehydrogenase family protein [Ruminococcus sp.]
MSFIDESAIETRAFIDGKFVQSRSGKTMQKYSSCTGQPLAAVTQCGEEDVNAAVEAAKQAFESGIWSDKTLAERREIILRLADLMEEHRDELARLDTYETCRAYRNYYYDSIPKAIEAVRYFAEAADKIYDTAIPPQKHSFGVVYRKPLGVVGIITPWNDPMVVGCWKTIPALLMGNTVVVKPAEQSSLSMLRTAALAKEAGVPDGVWNVIPGLGEEAGRALAMHEDVRGIFFTGSSATGKQIIQYAGQSNMKHVGLECGGKSPYIVTANCHDIKKAAQTLAANMFYNQGQICSAPSRVFVDSKIKDEFLKELFAASADYIPGDPYNIDNNVGCVVSEAQYDKVMQYIELGKREAGGWFSPEGEKDLPSGAKAVRPVIFYDVDNSARISQEEIFGPVVVVMSYQSTDEAVAAANDSPYGLAGAVWTDDLSEAYDIAGRIESGLVHINSYGEDDNTSPFGGVKQSGWGKDKSVYAFDEYTELKSVWVHF